MSGLGEEIVLNLEDMTNIKQTLNYDLAGGDHEFDAIRLWNLKDKLTIQVNFTDISQGVVVSFEQSLDGINFNAIPNSDCDLDYLDTSYTLNLLNLQTNYVRAKISLHIVSHGVVTEIIYKV